MTTSTDRFVGIDVSKETLDVHLRPDNRDLQYPNNDDGISALLGCLEKLTPTLVVIEATGGYENAVVAALSVAQIPLSLVNPKRARDFAKAIGRLAKTDKIDARTLAEFGDKVRPAVRPLPDADTPPSAVFSARFPASSGLPSCFEVTTAATVSKTGHRFGRESYKTCLCVEKKRTVTPLTLIGGRKWKMLVRRACPVKPSMTGDRKPAKLTHPVRFRCRKPPCRGAMV
jgi:hypothetical protein